ncbi:hypothetical protein VTN31DRAFT_1047 [Thermomyces dupontii]|uniref:uncharacterized protein n=1 Tax=Talaromyces thermophilus TaxID=28565 RepID=UPI00374270EA
MQYKVDYQSGRPVYRCHSDFGALDGTNINIFPKIVDFGLATRLGKRSAPDGEAREQHGIYPIQPDHYRAPEVILGCRWDSKADIWNFGVLLWDILGSRGLFQQIHDTGGQYNARSHLAEMVALLGPPPREFVMKSKTMSTLNWPEAIRNDVGKLCKNAQEFPGGPFFDTEGEFCHSALIASHNLSDTISFLEGKEREAFSSFVREMLTWRPEERKTARQLMEHPFLKLEN